MAISELTLEVIVLKLSRVGRILTNQVFSVQLCIIAGWNRDRRGLVIRRTEELHGIEVVNATLRVARVPIESGGAASAL